MNDEFEETMNALTFDPTAVPSVPSGPVVPDTPNVDQLEQNILNDMESYNYPITAAFIARHVGDTKSNVNKKLYKLERDDVVEQLECSPPLWRLIL